MKVTSNHQVTEQTDVKQVTALSVQDIITIGGPSVQHRNGFWKHSSRASDDRQPPADIVVHVTGPYQSQKRRRRCGETVTAENSEKTSSVSNSVVPGSGNSLFGGILAGKTVADEKCILMSDAVGQSQVVLDTASYDSKTEQLHHVVINQSDKCLMSSVSSADGLCMDRCGGKMLTRCEWDRCTSSELDTDSLLDHIRTVHVATQVKPMAPVSNAATDDDEPSYVCLWAGCKVYNKASCLLTWLERHIHSHVGAKPLRCIVAGCGARFASQYMLERHVNGHFAMASSPSMSALRPSRKGDANSKLAKKRKLRCLRPCPGNILSEYIDETKW
jgi:hypothetical protein